VLIGVTPDMEINQVEAFGPVLAILPFDEPEEAVAIANGTQYGLAAGVYTKDLARAHWTADRLEAGAIFVNQWFAGGNETPFGGFKRSGFGREKGVEAMANYLQVRNVAIRL
jgi:aldehyde dehydrogenase (NAD+)/betaine-aldehyde dehydrogenase